MHDCQIQSAKDTTVLRKPRRFSFVIRLFLAFTIVSLIPCETIPIQAESESLVQNGESTKGLPRYIPKTRQSNKMILPGLDEARKNTKIPPAPKDAREKNIVPTETRGHADDLLPVVFMNDKPNTVDDLRKMQDHLTDLLPNLRKCTVNLRVGGAQGSGVIVSSAGHILTAAHVAQQANLQITIILPNGRRVSGTTFGMNRGADSGMVKINEPGPWPFAPIRDPGDVKVGEWVVAMGHPGGYVEGRKPVVRLGRVLSAKEEFIRTDSVLVGGDSGGPLFDMHGQVVGVHSRIGASTSHNIHVPGSLYLKEWDRMMAKESWGGMKRLMRVKQRPILGVGGDQEATDCRIGSIAPGFPAAKAGIKVGDVILEFDGKQIENFRDLQIAVLQKKPNDLVTIKLKREGASMKIKLKLAATPAG